MNPEIDESSDEPHGLKIGERHERGSMYDRHPEPWHLDRKVPVIGAILLGLQCLTFVAWGATEAFKIDGHDHSILENKAAIAATTNQLNVVSERLARIEEKTNMEMTTLDRIENAVRRR